MVVSFGGYAAFPVVVMGWFLRTPVILQEQITGLGFANRISLPFAKLVALSREEGLPFAKGKGIVTGNPISPDIAKLVRKKKKHKPPAIFIFAGSRGSKQINEYIKLLMPKLLEDFVLYHHTGDLDYKKFSKLKKALPTKIQKRYHPMNFIDPSDVPNFYRKSDILIGRAGANTVSELMTVGIPSILIPLTWTNYQEQVLNANNAKKLGFATVMLPDEVTEGLLYKSIIEMSSDWKNRVSSMDYRLADLDIHASEKLVELLSEVVSD